MHEVSIAMAILEEIDELAASQHWRRVTSVRLLVGELSAVVDDALFFAWELAAQGTLAEGSRLEIVRVPVKVRCPVCEQPQRPRSANYLVCAACGSPAQEIVEGRELLVAGLEVDDDDSSRGSPAGGAEKELDARASAS